MHAKPDPAITRLTVMLSLALTGVAVFAAVDGVPSCCALRCFCP